jgi:hypothetical protein
LRLSFRSTSAAATWNGGVEDDRVWMNFTCGARIGGGVLGTLNRDWAERSLRPEERIRDRLARVLRVVIYIADLGI